MGHSSNRLFLAFSLTLAGALIVSTAWAQNEGSALPEGAIPDPANPSTYYAPMGENSYGCTFYIKRSTDDDVVTNDAIYFRTEEGEFSMDGAVCRKQAGVEIER